MFSHFLLFINHFATYCLFRHCSLLLSLMLSVINLTEKKVCVALVLDCKNKTKLESLDGLLINTFCSVTESSVTT